MTNASILQPDYWRQRARETREAAREVGHPGNRKILEEVAVSYEEMADLMEKRERPAARTSQIPPPARTAAGRLRQPAVPGARTCSSIQR
ncbi:MAG TPA: hypothetical protein VH722_21320 [Alphaproteobacteria bacterium]|jgi:hypothetical protein|nr:hypothetical protein [Alphaproteobacteria bacterium]